jgi:1-acyl-sn-glycerol-3-phosphate acyltransferase
VFHLHVTGLEHLPPRGPYIVAANHSNYLDGVVLGAVVPKKIAFLVMPRVYHSTLLHPPFHRHVGSIPINLERPDPGAIKRALRVLEEGNVVGIFPEGPFSLNGQLTDGQPGVALIALRSGVPVVPVAIRGTYEALVGRPLHIPRPFPLAARFGRPLEFGRIKRGWKIAHALRGEVTSRIMGEIAALLSHTWPAKPRA